MPPLDDEFDRETFYRGEDPDAGEEDDYELMPPDEEIIAGEKRRAAEAVDQASKSVDIDDLYRDQAAISDDIEDYVKGLRFQFGVKHLLWAMTALAVMFVVGKYIIGGLGAMLLVLTFLGLAAAYGWFTWQEQQRLQQWEAKRDELYRRHQERFKDDGVSKFDRPQNDPPKAPRASAPPGDDTMTFTNPPHFAFTTQDLLMLATMTCVVLFTMLRFGFAAGTLVLGLLLGAAVIASATLPNPPRAVATGAWLLLVFYVVMSFLSVLVG
ncbi:hypothetical protein [Aeoliella sp.]|uniref:hypothetical protein n=1 Tax=Aeoliella sp. TaxID=2795800 RepID=UPI003CCBFDD4